jgi:cytochrome o ubiquinol oxidase subunit 2
MGVISKIIIGFLITLNTFLFFWILLQGKTVAILMPQGTIASQEKFIILFILILGLSIVLPAIVLAYLVLFKYRATNTKAAYTPEWDTNKPLQIGLFLLLCSVIGIVAYFDWTSAHNLDPFKSLDVSNQMTIQVVSLRWKWLFIYPEQGVASVNYLAFPQKTGLNLQLTSDAPMNAFWIPQLGGQVYTMSGMSMQLHLLADKVGTYTGRSTSISGDGFAGMTFTAASLSQPDFNAWVSDIQTNAPVLDMNAYNNLTKPSQDNKPTVYKLGEKDLYNTIIMKYMTPSHKDDKTSDVSNMEMDGM